MTRLEIAACKGFQDFWKDIFEIWKIYKRYGEVVLEKDFEEGEESFKTLFTESENDDYVFGDNVLKYWKQNYHFVAGDYKELFNIFSDYKHRKNEKGGSLRLLPETGNYNSLETKGSEQTYSIEKSFYDDLVAKIKASKIREVILINSQEKMVLSITISPRTTGFYDEVVVNQLNEVITI